MTELNQAIESADVEIEAVEAEANDQASNEVEQVEVDADGSPEAEGDLGDKTEWPDKFANALHRKTKQLNKTRAQLQEERSRIKELEAKITALDAPSEQKVINPDDFETMDELLQARIDAMVEQRLKQANSQSEKAQLTQEQQKLVQERDTYVAEQANVLAKSIPDFTPTIQPYLTTLDNLPEPIADIFYSLENAPVAAYVLAKEGKLASMQFANPYVAAAEIMSAHERGMTMVSKPQKTVVSNAPEPIKGARGTAKTVKPLSQKSSREILDWAKS
jgi:hypothetical protein